MQRATFYTLQDRETFVKTPGTHCIGIGQTANFPSKPTESCQETPD